MKATIARMVVAGSLSIALAACGSASTPPPGGTSVTTTETVSIPMHAQARAMSDDEATALACSRYADAENRITIGMQGIRDVNAAADKSVESAKRALDANNDAFADWLATIGSAIAVAPNNQVRAAMDQAPAFYRYWTDTGTGPDAGVGAYGYSLVLKDVVEACDAAGHPMDLIADPSRPGLS